jgi:acid phosphatase
MPYALTTRRALLVAVAAALLAGCASERPAAPPAPVNASARASKLAHIGHIVVIYAENRSFDNLYGMFPGANGIDRATPGQFTQRDQDGRPLPELVVFGPDGKPDPHYPRLPNRPFRIDAPPVSKPPGEIIPNPTHTFRVNQEQIDGGRNDRFAALSSVGGLAMGYYDGSALRVWRWAQRYTLADNFFMGAFGGSFLNHQYLVCACAPRDPAAPASLREQLGPDGKLARQPDSPPATVGAVRLVTAAGRVTADGYAVNTMQPPWQPSGIPPAPGGRASDADPAGAEGFGPPLPPQTARTIGDTLSARGVDWAWYAQGWSAAVADGMRPPQARRSVIYADGPRALNFQPHHQPFNYFARFAPGTPDRAQHLKDGSEFLRAIDTGTLPRVSFYKPAGLNTQHPGYSDLLTGDAHVAGVLEMLRASPQWKDMLVIVTYDENGGFWDHVPPPSGPGSGDRFGPGTRIPAILIGPHVKRGFIDSTPYDTTSILKLITERFGLEPLPGVRAKAGDLTNALE